MLVNREISRFRDGSLSREERERRDRQKREREQEEQERAERERMVHNSCGSVTLTVVAATREGEGASGKRAVP